ncbi:MAG TPA: glycosyltransferase family 4 protein [Kiritimatiellia bacterium]|nr:glycosyltransferase family 4 protein [Kiritimatiellia bacterium]
MADTVSAKPRLCVLLESYYPVVGGMEAQARNLAGALKQAGVPLFFLTRRPSADLKPVDEVDGLEVVRVGPVGPSSRLRWLMVVSCLPALIRRRRDYDIIFVPGFRAVGLSAVWAAKWLGKRTVLKAESSGELSGEFFAGGFDKSRIGSKSGLARFLIKLRNRVLLRADAFVGLSSEQAAEFQSCGVASGRIQVIPQCLDETIFHPVDQAAKTELRKKLGLPVDQPLAVFTGRLVSYKGLPTLLRAWKRICAERTGGHLALVGAGGVDIYNCEDDLKKYVAENGLSDRVTFTGAVSNVPEYLKAADIYAFPTENEAFGLALIEAMSCGLAVMSTTTGGIKDFIEDEKNGLVVRSGNEDDMVNQLQRLLDDPATRARLGGAARETVTTRFTLDAVVRQYLDVFARMVGKSA